MGKIIKKNEFVIFNSRDKKWDLFFVVKYELFGIPVVLDQLKLDLDVLSNLFS